MGRGRVKAFSGQGAPQQKTVDIPMKDATREKCACGCDIFMISVKVFSVSAIVSPTGQAITVPVQTLLCSDCGAVYPPEKTLGKEAASDGYEKE